MNTSKTYRCYTLNRDADVVYINYSSVHFTRITRCRCKLLSHTRRGLTWIYTTSNYVIMR